MSCDIRLAKDLRLNTSPHNDKLPVGGLTHVSGLFSLVDPNNFTVVQVDSRSPRQTTVLIRENVAKRYDLSVSRGFGKDEDGTSIEYYLCGSQKIEFFPKGNGEIIEQREDETTVITHTS